MNNPKLTHKMEGYLVAISILEDKKKVARIGEIAKLLDIQSSTVNGMVKILAKRKLLLYEKYGYVSLTEEGLEIADQLIEKSNVLKKFLMKYLGVDEKIATIDSGGLKHYLSQTSFAKLKRFIYFLENRANHKDINCPEEIEKFVKK